MPPRPPRPCARCSVLVTDGGSYCPAHKAQAEQRRAIADRERGSPQSRGYDAFWRRVRKQALREHPLCQRCEEAGRVTAASIVHHIIAIEDAPRLRLDLANLMTLCRECHEEIHGRKV